MESAHRASLGLTVEWNYVESFHFPDYRVALTACRKIFS